jgi:TIR domain
MSVTEYFIPACSISFCHCYVESKSGRIALLIGMPSQEPTKHAFLSYARKDTQFALQLLFDLRKRGADLWIDQLDIKQAEHWDSAIEDALAKSPRLLVVLSPAAVKSNNVMDEVSYALTHGKLSSLSSVAIVRFLFGCSACNMRISPTTTKQVWVESSQGLGW